MLFREFILLTLCFLLTRQIYAKSGRRKGELLQPEEALDWNGKWFPFDPKKPPISGEKFKNDASQAQYNKESKSQLREISDWKGKWFPFDPKKIPVSGEKAQRNKSEAHHNKESNTWKLKWFPFKPSNFSYEESKAVCDDGQNQIEIDFNPNDKRHSLRFQCITSNRSLFEPNMALEAILVEQFIPPAFAPPIKCLNESISYDFTLNTYGAFRPVSPIYGTYTYLPKQRWLHSIAKGAIVMLYHPCASPVQVKILQNTLRSCLYRHIITPNQVLTPQRPLALLAWGKVLHMSVVDENQVVDFIKNNAKRGPMSLETSLDSKSLYATGLSVEAKLITDIEDSEICGYKDM